MPRSPALTAELGGLFNHLCSEERVVVKGRGVGRFKQGPLARFYVDAAADVRAQRRGSQVAELHARDEKDRATGQLFPPDIDVVTIDDSGPDL